MRTPKKNTYSLVLMTPPFTAREDTNTYNDTKKRLIQRGWWDVLSQTKKPTTFVSLQLSPANLKLSSSRG